MLIPRRSVGRAILRSAGPIAVWAATLVSIVALIPQSAWRLKTSGMLFSLGAIGLWRYGWYSLNVARALWYSCITFPLLRRAATRGSSRQPRRLFIVVASYRESSMVERLCFGSLVDACANLESEVTIVASVASERDAADIRAIMESREGEKRIRLISTIQNHGKRLALGYALRAVAREFNDPRTWHADAGNDVVILMDGDTSLARDAIEKCLPYFGALPRLGALTTNEIPVVFKESGAAVRRWYELKLSRRHQMMTSHALSRKLLTLTGRFSVFRAPIAVSEEFIRFLDRDCLTHWAYGRIRFLMGDDKSTMFCLLKNGWDMLYVPDSYAFCLEDRRGGFFKIANVMMLRWYGNMLRNNGRALRLGPSRLPLFTWFAFVDQRISMWTSLIGPVAAIALSITVSGYYAILYVAWVILTRLVQLSTLCLFGHSMRVVDLPFSVFDQWYGALVKIYCSVHMHEQVWQKARTEAQVVNSLEGSFGGVRRFLPSVLMQLYFAIFLVFVLLTTHLLRFPVLS